LKAHVGLFTHASSSTTCTVVLLYYILVTVLVFIESLYYSGGPAHMLQQTLQILQAWGDLRQPSNACLYNPFLLLFQQL
jgi:hypothetical protein